MVVSAVQGLLRATLLAAKRGLGLSAQMHTEDRRVLEQIILPAYAQRSDIARVLFVGCAAYTERYGELFSGREYWTIDPVVRFRKYGSARHHITDTLQNLETHVARGYFDLVLCNGVLGWGLNTRDDADRAFAACFACMRAGGELLLGWNDVAPRNRTHPDEIPALQRFERSVFVPAQTARWRVDGPNRHVFDFYKTPLEQSLS